MNDKTANLTDERIEELCARLRKIRQGQARLEQEAAAALESLLAERISLRSELNGLGPIVADYQNLSRQSDEDFDRAEKAEAQAEAMRALLQEWNEGMYEGPDFLRRVRLALHGDKGLAIAARESK